ncbi:ABC transporter substrate-binding protein [Bradyrhizobium sp.]|uniref:ABC transporter substrate-binding protein n=1 Tax=Bradyrhizobium sp. TaxID=376 RepID=UPI003C755B42
MRRREFISMLTGVAAVWPLAARAQQAGTRPRLAWIHPSALLADLQENGSVRAYRAFLEQLRKLGRVEGANLIVERYSGGGRQDHYEELVRNVVQSRPDVVFTSGSEIARHLKAATTTIPIVAVLTDPVADGFITNLAHPGGNVTGAAVDAGIEIWSKRLALLKESLPSASRVGLLCSRAYWENPGKAGEALRAAAPKLGVSVSGCVQEGALQEAGYRRVFDAIQRDRLDGIVVHDQAENFTNRKIIVELARSAGLPAIYPYREYVELGGLMAYAVDLPDAFRHAADHVDKILRGVSPSELPFYQQTRFELLINLKTAKALNLNIPATLLGSSDEVIE